MKKINIFLLALIGAVAVSCNEPDHYTGVVVNKVFRTSRRKDFHYLYIIDSVGSHCVRVDETTYHKYRLGDVATIEPPRRY